MNRRWGLSVTAAVIWCLVILAAGGHARAQQWPSGIPGQLRDLRDLQLVCSPTSHLTSGQATSVLMGWLEKERANPHPTVVGLGGPITSSYIEVQLIMALGDRAEPLALTAIADAPSERDVRRSGAVLALGRMGDASRVPAILSVLQDHPDGFYRALAIDDLRRLGAVQALGAIQGALNDPFVFKMPRQRESGSELRYPVREAAREAIRCLQDKRGLADAAKRVADFRGRMARR